MSCARLTMFAMLALISLPPCIASDGNRVVALRAAVEIRQNATRNGAQPNSIPQNWVWLSDLLPADAPAGLRKTGAVIAMCRAPLPGSIRILDAEQIERRLRLQPDLLSQLRVPSRISVQTAGWPIREESVRYAISKFLSAQGWKNDLPETAKIQWPEGFAATVEDPLLQVTSLEWDDRQQSVQARLRCSNRISCGTFMVHLILSPALAQQWREDLSRESASSSELPQSALAVSGPVLAERGKLATLIFDLSGMRISLRVICLQPGALNQQIRVFDAQSRRVFRAEVVGTGLLRATL